MSRGLRMVDHNSFSNFDVDNCEIVTVNLFKDDIFKAIRDECKDCVIQTLTSPYSGNKLIPFNQLSFYKYNNWEYFDLNEYWVLDAPKDKDITKLYDSYSYAVRDLYLIVAKQVTVDNVSTFNDETITDIMKLVPRVEGILKFVICITEDLIGIPAIPFEYVDVVDLRVMADTGESLYRVRSKEDIDLDTNFEELKKIYAYYDKFKNVCVSNSFVVDVYIRKLLAVVTYSLKHLVKYLKGDSASIYREYLKIVKLIDDRISNKYSFNYT